MTALVGGGESLLQIKGRAQPEADLWGNPEWSRPEPCE